MESGPCQGCSDTVSRLSCCFMGSKKATFILAMMNYKSNSQELLVQERVERGCRRFIYKNRMVKIAICEMCIHSFPLKLDFGWSPLWSSYFGLSQEDRSISPNNVMHNMLFRFHPHGQVLLFFIIESKVAQVPACWDKMHSLQVFTCFWGIKMEALTCQQSICMTL